jgi:hypothetical protein
MSTFRNKPLFIEAEQYFPDQPWPAGITAIDAEMEWPRPEDAWLQTPQGGHFIGPGDWIITDAKGAKCPCKDEIFRSLYQEYDA